MKYSFFSMTKAVEALHNRGIVHRYILQSITVSFSHDLSVEPNYTNLRAVWPANI